ncbi:hypothetical protein B0H16DRAFT_1699667 [Mycena metata]|uniref:Uncharacterized protein n=1 Tax=Mycena metata TaxID=1033252 RepID=A0AAD7HIC3_9AGAR|nr:hypothetical protein B0H16DRAFT_1699667 [Mycena metata]
MNTRLATAAFLCLHSGPLLQLRLPHDRLDSTTPESTPHVLRWDMQPALWTTTTTTTRTRDGDGDWPPGTAAAQPAGEHAHGEAAEATCARRDGDGRWERAERRGDRDREWLRNAGRERQRVNGAAEAQTGIWDRAWESAGAGAGAGREQ